MVFVSESNAVFAEFICFWAFGVSYCDRVYDLALLLWVALGRNVIVENLAFF